MPEVNIRTADAGTLDVQQYLALLQISTLLDDLQAWLSFCDPEIVRWVRVYTNIWL